MVPIRRQVQVVNALGLHLRAADRFVRLAQQYRSEVCVHRDGRAGNGRSILDLTTLVAECGSRLEIEVHGPDAEEAIAALCALVEGGFGDAEEGHDGPHAPPGQG